MLAYALASKPCSEATDIGYYMALFRNPNIIRYNLNLRTDLLKLFCWFIIFRTKEIFVCFFYICLITVAGYAAYSPNTRGQVMNAE